MKPSGKKLPAFTLCAAYLLSAASGCRRQTPDTAADTATDVAADIPADASPLDKAAREETRIDALQRGAAVRAFREEARLEPVMKTLKRKTNGDMTAVTATLRGYGLCFSGTAWFDSPAAPLPRDVDVERGACP